MPFKSEAQRRFLYAKHPEIAKRWSREYPNQGKLPEHVDQKSDNSKAASSEGALMSKFMERVLETCQLSAITIEKQAAALADKAKAEKVYHEKVAETLATLVKTECIDDLPEDKQAMANILSTPEGALRVINEMATKLAEKAASLPVEQVDAQGRKATQKRASWDSQSSPYVGARTSRGSDAWNKFGSALGVA